MKSIAYVAGLVVTFIATSGFALWRYRTPYNALHDVKAVFNPVTKTMAVSFYYLHSFATLVDYKTDRTSSRGRGTRHYFTLISQYIGRGHHNINPLIQKVGDARVQVVIPMERFDPVLDHLLYRDRKGNYLIPVTIETG